MRRPHAVDGLLADLLDLVELGEQGRLRRRILIGLPLHPAQTARTAGTPGLHGELEPVFAGHRGRSALAAAQIQRAPDEPHRELALLLAATTGVASLLPEGPDPRADFPVGAVHPAVPPHTSAPASTAPSTPSSPREARPTHANDGYANEGYANERAGNESEAKDETWIPHAPMDCENLTDHDSNPRH